MDIRKKHLHSKEFSQLTIGELYAIIAKQQQQKKNRNFGS